MSTEQLPVEPTRCEWCGADFDPADRPDGAPSAPAGSRPDTAVADGEPLTHCEWCGAEYPTPRDQAG